MEISPSVLYQAVQKDLRVFWKARCPTLEDSSISFALLDRNTDPVNIASRALLRSIVKKFEPSKRDCDLADKAIALFCASNDRCLQWREPDDPEHIRLLDEMCFIASQELPALDWQEALHDLVPGPGASVGSRGRNSAFEKLFINNLTTTEPALYSEYRAFMAKHPTWWSAELRRLYIQAGTAFSVVPGSNLSTVAKNSDIDRTICTEPSLNMLFQQALGTQLTRVLNLHYGYSKVNQPQRNRRAARIGSRYGSRCTVDLSSASDTISLSLVRRLLPSDWVAAIEDCRSPQTLYNGSSIELNMVSSMGNGFTFPLMTYIFSCMLKALCRLHNRKFTSFSCLKYEFGVFGDDIIVPTDLYEETLQALSALGFIPNTDKSFGAGPFRESCGADWFNGKSVRGVYCKHLRSAQDRYSLINRLNRWSAMWKIPLLHTVQLLLPKEWKTSVVPTDEDDTAGLKVPMFMLDTWRPTYYAYKPRLKGVRLFTRKDILKSCFDNPFGLILAASSGWVRSDRVSRRSRKPVYSRVKLTCPYWARKQDLAYYGVSFADWEVITYINLTGLV